MRRGLVRSTRPTVVGRDPYRLRPLGLGALLVAAVLVVVPAVAAWLVTGATSAAAVATSVDRPAAPSVSRAGGSVGITWSATTLASGTAVGRYDVLRHVGATTTTVCTGATTTSCTDPSPVAGAATYGVVARIGASWRSAESPATALTYDDVAPTTVLSRTPAPNGAGWNNANVSVTLTATDTGSSPASGVKEVHYTVNGGTEVVVTGATTTFQVTQEQVNQLAYWSVDANGNVESPKKQAQVKLDKTAPVTTTSPVSSTTVWRSSGSVSLSATDGVSGVTSTAYKVDGASAYTTYTAPFLLTQGTHTVTYRSVDAAGNTEADKTATIKVDLTAPTSSVNPTSGATTTTVTVTGTDTGGSGMASVQYQVDGGTYQNVVGSTATVTLTGNGTHTLKYRSVDNAGNVEAERTATYSVDAAGPTITPTAPVQGGSYPTGNSGTGSWSNVCGSGRVCANVSDTSAITSVTYNLVGLSGGHVGDCWSGSSFLNNTTTCAPTANLATAPQYVGTSISRSTMGAGTWRLTWTAKDSFNNTTTVAITFTTT